MLKFLIFNALITQTFIKSYHLRFLTSVPETLVNIFQKINVYMSVTLIHAYIDVESVNRLWILQRQSWSQLDMI